MSAGPIHAPRDRARQFSVSYTHDGRRLEATVFAHDWGDAVDQIEAIGRTGFVNGEVIARFGAGPTVLPFAWAWVQFRLWWLNRTRGDQ